MRRAATLIALGTLAPGILAISGCYRAPDEATEATATEVPLAVAAPPPVARGAAESQYGTPVKDRAATLGLLNKRNNIVQDLVMKTGETRRIGNVVVRLASCERTPPWEDPPEEGAFVQVYVEERAKVSEPLAWHRVFSGWLFKNSPSLNVVEHPIYDVWVKSCAMKFPGEEETPAAAAWASKAAKPAGKPAATASASAATTSTSATASPLATATPVTKPTPSASPSPR